MTKKTTRKRGSGRTYGSPNRKTIREVHEKSKTRLPDDVVRRSPRFKAYDRLKLLAADIHTELELALANQPQVPAEIKDCQARLLNVLKVLVQYEKPKLTAVKVSGDPNAPILFDLSGLSTKDLNEARRIALRARQVQKKDGENDEAGEDAPEIDE